MLKTQRCVICVEIIEHNRKRARFCLLCGKKRQKEQIRKKNNERGLERKQRGAKRGLNFEKHFVETKPKLDEMSIKRNVEISRVENIKKLKEYHLRNKITMSKDISKLVGNMIN